MVIRYKYFKGKSFVICNINRTKQTDIAVCDFSVKKLSSQVVLEKQVFLISL